MRYLLAVFMLFAFASTANAELKTETVAYADGGKTFEGYLAYDDSLTGKRPGVLVVHEWWGLNDYTKKRTEMLAELGFVAFAADIYGKGIRPANSKEAGEQAGKLRGGDRTLLRQRVNRALEVLKGNPMTDRARLAAIGYCFGGTTVLELARSGADIAGVVSFHGNLDTPSPNASRIKTRVLALTGADDPYVPPKQVQEFVDEMRGAGADWYMESYGGAVHSFTNPASGSDPSKGLAYNEKADKRSWQAMRDFFAEIFR